VPTASPTPFLVPVTRLPCCRRGAARAIVVRGAPRRVRFPHRPPGHGRAAARLCLLSCRLRPFQHP